jgi:uncharacterized peroxidase-related enzyme
MRSQEYTVTHLPSLPPKASLLEVFKTFPETSKPLIEFHQALLRGPSPFSEMERELIAAYISGLNQCCYCHGVHTAVAERLGAPSAMVSRLMESSDLAAVPEKLQPVLRYAQKLTRDPAGIAHADAEAIFAAGWNETALYHTVAVTALFKFHEPPRRGTRNRARPGVCASRRPTLGGSGLFVAACADLTPGLTNLPRGHSPRTRVNQ